MTPRALPEVRRVLGRSLTGRPFAGPRIDDALRAAADIVAAGRLVALEHLPGRGDDAAAEIAALIGRLQAAGLAGACELTLAVDRLGGATVRHLAGTAAAVGTGVVLSGEPADVDALAAELPSPGVVVPAGEDGAEARCRALATGRVRLVQGRGAAADLAFVRCLNVLMAGPGRPAVATTDPRLIAIAGERAAWNDRSPDSWEHVMPYGVRTDEQQRLVAAGYAVRTAVLSGHGAPVAAVRRLGSRP